MRVIGFVIWIVFICSCCFSHEENKDLSRKYNEDVGVRRSELVREVLVSDTCFYSVESIGNGNVKLVWGDGFFERATKLRGQFEYDKIFCGKERQVLSFACGSPCLAYVILPMNNMTDSVQVILDPIGHSKEYDFVVTASSERENELIVYDLDNKKKKRVMVEMKNCEATFYTDCLDLEFEGDSCFTVKTTEDDFFRWKLDDIFNQ